MLRNLLKLALGGAAGLVVLALFALLAFRPPRQVLFRPLNAAVAAAPASAPVPAPYDLRFVELDDDGFFAEPRQVRALLLDLQQRMDETDTTVLLYVHGWNHNAAEGNENLACFKELATGAALMQSTFVGAQGRPRAVFAVYVGWPGVVYDNRALNKALSFFGRQATADRIGERGDLLSLFGAIARLRDAHQKNGAGAKFVIVAHSLGARLTYKALRPVMQSSLDRADTRSGQLADVAVLVNPALSADEHQSLARLLAGSATPRAQAPRFVVATSESDEVLGGIYPLSQRVASFLRSDFSLGATGRTQPVGLFDAYVTHTLAIDPPGRYRNPEGAGGCPTLDHRELEIVKGAARVKDPRELYAYDRVAHYGADGALAYSTQLKAVAGMPASPIMVVKVSGEVIPNHNDIFTSPFVDFVSRVINAGLFPQLSRPAPAGVP